MTDDVTTTTRRRGRWVAPDGRRWDQKFRPAKWGPDDMPEHCPEGTVFLYPEKLQFTDYTEPSTVDVAEVCANINMAYQARGHRWTKALSWPNVTVKAMADRIAELESRLSDKDRYVDYHSADREGRCRGCGGWVDFEHLDAEGFGPDCYVQDEASAC